MMAMLRRQYPGYFPPWPMTVEQVTEHSYAELQELVRRFIREKHEGAITPVQFDDIYWRELNR